MAALTDLINQVQDTNLRDRLLQEASKLQKQRKFGLVYEEHIPEATLLYDVPIRKGIKAVLREGKISDCYFVKKVDGDNAYCVKMDESHEEETLAVADLVAVAHFGEPIYPCLRYKDSICNAPDSDLWHTLIEADNYHALQLLEYLYGGQVDCIYIDPPYNTGARDWKYNNNYVDSNDSYRHSKWLSMMEKRLKLAKKLLNPKDSVLIVTIDEKEYLHLGCLLEQMFPEANIQMVIDVINPRGTNRENEFSRVEEYIFCCRFGLSKVYKTTNNMLGNTDETGKARVWYAFNRGNNPRSSANAQFFPIYINEATKQIVSVGESMSIENHSTDFPQIEGLTAVFPINDRGGESIWRAIPSTTRDWVRKGYVKVSGYDKKNARWTLSYIPSGMQSRIELGDIIVNGKDERGALELTQIDVEDEQVSPRSVWVQKYHNATDYGATILKNIIPNHVFSFPKSLYAVRDTLNFFISNKPNALVIDFFAGSGTTLHAINLLNSEDGGRRRCILVTNNEVSDLEAKNLTKQGYKIGDPEWEALGIANYVTWPRTTCSILGKDINGNPLKGIYLDTDDKKLMSDGFAANAIFFKLGFLDKTMVSLGRQFRELLPLLWMKAGAKGQCPTIEAEETPTMLVLPENKFAVLTEESAFYEFAKQVNSEATIETIFIVTDSETSYHDMIAQLNCKHTFQLYRDYLDNFRINKVR